MNLSRNFTLAELTKSQTASRYGIDNQPSARELKCLIDLCENVLQPIRKQFGFFRVTSGYRSPELNQTIGGSRTSQHVLGQAADFEIAGHANVKVAEWIQANLEYDQLIAEYLSKKDGAAGWIHVSYVKGKNRKETLSCVGRGRYVHGIHFID